MSKKTSPSVAVSRSECCHTADSQSVKTTEQLLGDFEESSYLVRWAKLIDKYFVKLKPRFAHPTFTV